MNLTNSDVVDLKIRPSDEQVYVDSVLSTYGALSELWTSMDLSSIPSNELQQLAKNFDTVSFHGLSYQFRMLLIRKPRSPANKQFLVSYIEMYYPLSLESVPEDKVRPGKCMLIRAIGSILQFGTEFFVHIDQPDQLLVGSVSLIENASHMAFRLNNLSWPGKGVAYWSSFGERVEALLSQINREAYNSLFVWFVSAFPHMAQRLQRDCSRGCLCFMRGNIGGVVYESGRPVPILESFGAVSVSKKWFAVTSVRILCSLLKARSTRLKQLREEVAANSSLASDRVHLARLAVNMATGVNVVGVTEVLFPYFFSALRAAASHGNVDLSCVVVDGWSRVDYKSLSVPIRVSMVAPSSTRLVLSYVSDVTADFVRSKNALDELIVKDSGDVYFGPVVRISHPSHSVLMSKVVPFFGVLCGRTSVDVPSFSSLQTFRLEVSTMSMWYECSRMKCDLPNNTWCTQPVPCGCDFSLSVCLGLDRMLSLRDISMTVAASAKELLDRERVPLAPAATSVVSRNGEVHVTPIDVAASVRDLSGTCGLVVSERKRKMGGQRVALHYVPSVDPSRTKHLMVSCSVDSVPVSVFRSLTTPSCYLRYGSMYANSCSGMYVVPETDRFFPNNSSFFDKTARPLTDGTKFGFTIGPCVIPAIGKGKKTSYVVYVVLLCEGQEYCLGSFTTSSTRKEKMRKPQIQGARLSAETLACVFGVDLLDTHIDSVSGIGHHGLQGGADIVAERLGIGKEQHPPESDLEFTGSMLVEVKDEEDA
jgi:hypothetical protein